MRRGSRATHVNRGGSLRQLELFEGLRHPPPVRRPFPTPLDISGAAFHDPGLASSRASSVARTLGIAALLFTYLLIACLAT